MRTPRVVSKLYPIQTTKMFLEGEGNLAQVTASSRTYYFGWYAFNNQLRKQFERCFGYPMPGVTDCYHKTVRIVFDVDAFRTKATSSQKEWLHERIEIPESFPLTDPNSNHSNHTATTVH